MTCARRLDFRSDATALFPTLQATALAAEDTWRHHHLLRAGPTGYCSSSGAAEHRLRLIHGRHPCPTTDRILR